MEKTTTTQQTSATYTCSTCGRQGKAHQMGHVQMFGKPSVGADGQVLNIVCGRCADDGRKWAGFKGFDFEVHYLDETLRILAANQRRREEDAVADARAEAARQLAAKEFYGKLGSGAQSVEEDSTRQVAAKARRAAKRDERSTRESKWDESRNGAANGYLVAVG